MQPQVKKQETNPAPVDIPSLISRLSKLGQERRGIEEQERTIKQQLLLHFVNAGIKTAETDTHLAIRQVSERLDFSKRGLTEIYGEQFIKETEDLLREHGMISKAEFIQLREKKKKRDLKAEAGEYFK